MIEFNSRNGNVYCVNPAHIVNFIEFPGSLYFVCLDDRDDGIELDKASFDSAKKQMIAYNFRVNA